MSLARPMETEDEADRLEGTPHPRQATQLIGHADAERMMLEAYRTNRLPHAIILGGPAGIGKATFAWRLARFLLSHPNPASDEVRRAQDLSVAPETRVAGQIAALTHPDVALLRREVNDKTKRFFSEIRTEDVRRTIQLFQRAASAGGYRICIVDSAEDLNRSSANALLKLIEEPPPASLFLLVAHRPGLILPTIRSRARLLRLGPLAPDAVGAVLESLGPPWSEHPAVERRQAAEQAHGSVHGALRLLGSRSLELDATIQRLLQRLPAVDWNAVHRLADKVTGRDGEAGFDLLMTAVFDFLDAAVQRGAAGQGDARTLAPYAEAWEKIAAEARETDALNLDRRPLVLTIFADLATATRGAV